MFSRNQYQSLVFSLYRDISEFPRVGIRSSLWNRDSLSYTFSRDFDRSYSWRLETVAWWEDLKQSILRDENPIDTRMYNVDY
jgi:hypothetical protein